MRSELSKSDSAFQAQLDEFFAAHTPSGVGHSIWSDSPWLAALRERNWLAASWPAGWGGPGFSATEKYLFYRACHRHIAQFVEPVSFTVVGPLLGGLADLSLAEVLLPEILQQPQLWDVSGVPTDAPVARISGGHWQLEGRANLVPHAQGAQRLLGLAQLEGAPSGNSWGLFICSLKSAGVNLEVKRTLADEDILNIEFSALTLLDYSQGFVGRPPGPGQGTAELELAGLVCELSDPAGLNLPDYLLGRSALSQTQLDQIDQQVAQLSDAADLLARRDEVAVDIAALQALELRYLDAQSRQVELPFPAELLALKSKAVEMKVGSLLMDSFGYYVLPYPDLWLQHNQGEVGPAGARSATQAWLARTVSENYASVSRDIYAKLAQEQQDTGER